VCVPVAASLVGCVCALCFCTVRRCVGLLDGCCVGINCLETKFVCLDCASVLKRVGVTG
jgi:hypothetical protein